VSRIGAPTLYYGDEIGMEDVPIPPERVQDPWEKHVPGLRLGRDPQGTPMQWDDTPNAGFSTWEIIEGFKARVTCSAFTVRRSPFAVHRSPFAVRRHHQT
jgi:alpha-glucosidase